MKTTLLCMIIVAATWSTTSRAAGSYIQLPSDLIIHPTDTAQFFSMEAQKVSSSPSWQWASLQFDQPYHTSWTNVQAMGPFSLQISTAQLATQTISFDLAWQNPAIQVGGFEIHDTVTRTTYGVNLIVHLDGVCSNMAIRVPAGQWHVKGSLTWNIENQKFVLNWSDFQFSMNGSATPQVNMGNCMGPAGLQANLQQTFQLLAHDQNWLTDVLKQGVMDWAQSTLNELQSQLLISRHVPLNANLGLDWNPQGLLALPGGLVRIPGVLQLNRNGVNVPPVVLQKTYAESTLAQATTSGFIMPRDALPRLIQFLYHTGDLQYRVNSGQISSFQSLMSSRFFQFFLWPDLMNFSQDTQFWFDIGTEAAPQLRNGVMAKNGGIIYDVSAPLIVHQWAPNGNQYVPYIDFRAPLTGRISAQLQNGSLSLQLQPDQLNVTSQYRPEFTAIRSVNDWIADGILGSNVSSYLASQTYQLKIPAWQVGQNVSIQMSDIQIWHQSFRIPLQFQATP